MMVSFVLCKFFYFSLNLFQIRHFQMPSCLSLPRLGFSAVSVTTSRLATGGLYSTVAAQRNLSDLGMGQHPS